MPTALPRLLVLTTTYPRWASDHEPSFVHDLCRELAREFDVLVVTPRSHGAARTESMDGVSIKRFRYAPGRLQTLVHGGGIMGNLKGSPWKWLLVPPLLLAMGVAYCVALARFKPDLVHAHWLVPAGMVASLLPAGVPLVLTAHGTDVLGLKGWLWRRVRTFARRRASLVTCVGASVQHRLLAEYPGEVAVVPMGTDFSVFQPRADVRRIPGRLLFVGRLIASKRPDLVVESLRVLRDRGIEAQLDMVGDGPMRASLADLAAKLDVAGHVRFLGRLRKDALSSCYRSAAVTVMGSGDEEAPEGFGLVAIEAVACGCPVACPRNESLAGALPNGAPVHFAARPLDKHSVSDAIVRAMERPEVDARLVADLESTFGWPAIGRAHASLFRGVIATRRGSRARLS